MPGNEGSKQDGNFTNKEKWMIGVYIVTAITSTVLFVMTLVVIFQLKDQATGTQANTTENEFAASTASEGWEEKYSELLNQTNENKNQTKKLIADFRIEFTEMKNKMETTTNKSKKLIELAFKGWYQATNKLLYKRSRIEKTFTDAWDDCKQQGSRLASTGMRDADVRSDIWLSMIPDGEYVWIGLNKSYYSNWVWSDGEAYDRSYLSEPLSKSNGARCASLKRESSVTRLTVSDYYPTTEYAFVCEYNATHLTVY